MFTSDVDNRQLISLDGDGVILHGTYHKPRRFAEERIMLPRDKGVGVVFFNALSSPRSLYGDSGAYWANSFAAAGYPCFRFDLPGLGDSYGELPDDLLKFANEGSYAAIASSKLTEIVSTQLLAGAVMFGHCAGATTAIYAAADCHQCKGLILMDPYFNLPKGLTPSLKPELVHWARRSKVGAVLRGLYDAFRESSAGFQKQQLPPNANLKLIEQLKSVLNRKIPILIIRAPQPAVLGNRSFDYLSYVLRLATFEAQFSVKTIEDTDHSFANCNGRTSVRRHAEQWLSQHFPLEEATSQLEGRKELSFHPLGGPKGAISELTNSHTAQ